MELHLDLGLIKFLTFLLLKFHLHNIKAYWDQYSTIIVMVAMNLELS